MTNDVQAAAERILHTHHDCPFCTDESCDAVTVAQAVLDAQGREARLREALLGLSGGGSAPCWCARLPHTETCLAASAALSATEAASDAI